MARCCGGTDVHFGDRNMARLIRVWPLTTMLQAVANIIVLENGKEKKVYFSRCRDFSFHAMGFLITRESGVSTPPRVSKATLRFPRAIRSFHIFS